MVSQNGIAVHVANGIGCLREKRNGNLDVVMRLPPHPNPAHARSGGVPTCILPKFAAEMVTESLQLPCDANPSYIYVGEAFESETSEQPFLRAVWCVPELADKICENPSGTHRGVTHKLHQTWKGGMGEGVNGCSRSGATQTAAGLYTELGVGIMAGGGRCSVSIAGEKSNVPFSRSPDLSDKMEPLLSSFLSGVASVVNVAFGDEVCRSHTVPAGCPTHIAASYQYPRLVKGTPPLMSHQVAIRGPTSNSDLDVFCSVSDLHVDRCDGGGTLGSCTVHTCLPAFANGEVVDGGVDIAIDGRLAARGLAVFPGCTGGRGVHLYSMVPGWQCIIMMQTNSRLHGSVVSCGVDEVDGLPVPSQLSSEVSELENLEMTRVLTYPLKRIELLLKRLAKDADGAARLELASDKHLQSRMRNNMQMC